MPSGSQIETEKSQSPENVEVLPEETLEETLNNEAAPVQVVPPSYFNPVPRMISGQDMAESQSATQENSGGGTENGNNYQYLLNLKLIFVFCSLFEGY